MKAKLFQNRIYSKDGSNCLVYYIVNAKNNKCSLTDKFLTYLGIVDVNNIYIKKEIETVDSQLKIVFENKYFRYFDK